MKVTDYIARFLEEKNIKDVFGYPGAVVCHLMDSMSKSTVCAHVNYHEQGAAFAACGYAQIRNEPAVAYANVGPGATNLVTGVANAWFDSIPCIFISGQVDCSAMTNEYFIRQRGIQELHADELFKSITKFSVSIKDKEDVVYYLEKAYFEVTSGRPGPVLLEIPADIQRADIDEEQQRHFECKKVTDDILVEVEMIIDLIVKAEKPCFLLGNGIKQSKNEKKFKEIIKHVIIPCVSSLPAMDILSYDHELNMGYIGMNAHRYSNFILGKSDLIIALGSRLDVKQVGVYRKRFVPGAKLVRIDIDKNELEYKVRNDEVDICVDLNVFLQQMLLVLGQRVIEKKQWNNTCKEIKQRLYNWDMNDIHFLIREIGRKFEEHSSIVLDVGQHLVYGVQALEIKERQRILLSLGLASMGYSLPAAIGAYYGSGEPVYVICGDGGFQMNMQELQFIRRDNLPIKILVLNNNSLGMIREFQERNFEARYIHSVPDEGYAVPSMKKIAKAYDLDYNCIRSSEDLNRIDLRNNKPEIIEIIVKREMYLYPRMNRTKEIQDMDPEMPRDIYNKIMEM